MSHVKVTVVCFGALREYLPDPSANSALVELEGGGAVSDVADSLGIPVKHLHAVLIDGERADASTPVGDGSEVTLMPAFSGGASTEGKLR